MLNKRNTKENQINKTVRAIVYDLRKHQTLRLGTAEKETKGNLWKWYITADGWAIGVSHCKLVWYQKKQRSHEDRIIGYSIRKKETKKSWKEIASKITIAKHLSNNSCENKKLFFLKNIKTLYLKFMQKEPVQSLEKHLFAIEKKIDSVNLFVNIWGN